MRGLLCQSLHINVHAATACLVLNENLDNALFFLLCSFPFICQGASPYHQKASLKSLA